MSSTRSTVAPSEHDQVLQKKAALPKKLASMAWGLFFIWVGVALLAHVGWGVALLGVGGITLAAQAARMYVRLRLEPFWLFLGIACVVLGGWEVLQRQLGEALLPGSPVPILFIAVGVVVVVAALLGKPRR